MLSALGVDELGSRFGPMPGARAFYWACTRSPSVLLGLLINLLLILLLEFGKWACAPIF